MTNQMAEQEKSTLRIVYRYDSEELTPDQTIRSQRDHISRLSDVEKQVESCVRKAMSDGARIRSTSLYTWADLPMAEAGWRGWKDAHLYRLEVKEEDIIFVGDLDFFNDAKDAVAGNASPDEAVAQYCAGNVKSAGRRVELLVREAKVLEKLRDASDHLNPSQRLLRQIADEQGSV